MPIRPRHLEPGATLGIIAPASAPPDPQKVDLAVAALEQLARSLDPQEELPLALAGSIAKRLLAHFSGNIRARCVESQGDSADGALLLVGSALNDKTGTR